MFAGNGMRFRVQKTGLLGKLLTAGLLVAALAFSLVVFAVVITAGGVAFGYLWWKTRAVRQHIREQSAQGPAQSVQGRIIEGEIVTKGTARPGARSDRQASPLTIDPAPAERNAAP
jgi:hypothetical protein